MSRLERSNFDKQGFLSSLITRFCDKQRGAGVRQRHKNTSQDFSDTLQAPNRNLSLV